MKNSLGKEEEYGICRQGHPEQTDAIPTATSGQQAKTRGHRVPGGRDAGTSIIC